MVQPSKSKAHFPTNRNASRIQLHIDYSYDHLIFVKSKEVYLRSWRPQRCHLSCGGVQMSNEAYYSSIEES